MFNALRMFGVIHLGLAYTFALLGTFMVQSDRHCMLKYTFLPMIAFACVCFLGSLAWRKQDED